jgi:hypothetical protein
MVRSPPPLLLNRLACTGIDFGFSSDRGSAIRHQRTKPASASNKCQIAVAAYCKVETAAHPPDLLDIVDSGRQFEIAVP